MKTARRVAPLLHLVRQIAPAPDAELLARFIDGRDDAAFAAIVERHGTMVIGRSL